MPADLSISVTLSAMARSELHSLTSWDSVLEYAKTVAKDWKLQCTFKNVCTCPDKKHFDEISSDERLQDKERKFQVHVFYKIVDVALGQLDQRFIGQSLVSQMFVFIQPWNLIKFSNKQLSAHVDKIPKVYGRDM